MTNKLNLLLVGCGKMGGALLNGWRREHDLRVAVVDPAPKPDDFAESDDARWLDSADAIDPNFAPSAVVIAVKPQHMATTLPAYARYRQSVFLSIAAGVTLNRLNELLGNTGHAIVRAMPNLPACIGQGVSAAVANSAVTREQRALCDTLLRAAGDVAWLTADGMMDAVTALSGSGPAYLFALTESMAAAGENLGLSPELALRLARQTVIGSGALLAQSPESPSALRQAVTSKGGTTEAALKHLLAEDSGLPSLMLQAMQAAAKRSAELAT